MGPGMILAVTAAVYLIVTWLLRWGVNWLLGSAPVEAECLTGPHAAFNMCAPMDQVEYAAYYTAWYSLIEGIPAVLYVVRGLAEEEADQQLLEHALCRWPNLLVVQE
ncbi:hypothetical protein DFP93_10871 [Aneurinibacillus soli]|uniref:Uncharacterized protein n=1 Tax=Aneurinibacillus soli TaxID=1500254 RepID=A0A0U5C4B5_9BACL|nr:hypothetical protein [Aneurinibacillus soli]PYE61498.1 hypothetical protein DFP93_10871 [Aneurinibacillus soli]BAU26547.1 hypothetical protein CB4_00674 [Aneurinibacillus soli]